jgi:voltage-gated potassium channel
MFLRWVRIIRMLRLSRIAQLMTLWQRRQLINPTILRLIFFMVWMFFIAHWIACGWMLLDGIETAPNMATRYLRAFYWSVTTLTTVGYGDITPVTNAQTLFTMGVMLLGVGGYGYVIGNVASLLANIDVVKAQHKKKLEELNTFIKVRQVPRALQERLRSFYDHMWRQRKGYDESSIMEELPFSLKTDVALHLKKEVLEKLPILNGAGPGLIRDLALKLKPAIATPGDFIIRRGEAADAMYFISHGQVEVLSGDLKTVYATLSDGSFFGEMSLLSHGSTRSANIRALDFCDLYVLDKDTFDKVLSRHKEFQQRIQEIAFKRQRQNTSR